MSRDRPTLDIKPLPEKEEASLRQFVIGYEEIIRSAEAEIARLKEENDLLRDNPELDTAGFAIFAARQIKRGANYSAKDGIWWTSESKPGVLKQRDNLLAEVKTFLEEPTLLHDRIFGLNPCRRSCDACKQDARRAELLRRITEVLGE